MDHGPLADRIIKAFDTMSGQLQAGARYVLERPHDVALLSMREQARQAGVQPATMSRLAKNLWLAGYDAVGGAGRRGVLLAASLRPYARLRVELAEYAVDQGMAVGAITDSEVAPRAQIAQRGVIVATDSPSFLPAMSPAFVVAQILGAII